MSMHNDRITLTQIIEHTKEAIEYTRNVTIDDLSQNRLLELALIRLLEIIGEAAKRLSQDTRNLYPEIPWSEVIGLRNRLIHGYDRVDRSILWNTIQHDLPVLLQVLDANPGE